MQWLIMIQNFHRPRHKTQCVRRSEQFHMKAINFIINQVCIVQRTKENNVNLNSLSADSISHSVVRPTAPRISRTAEQIVR